MDVALGGENFCQWTILVAIVQFEKGAEIQVINEYVWALKDQERHSDRDRYRWSYLSTISQGKIAKVVL